MRLTDSRPRFSTLADLLADCPDCGHSYEILPPQPNDRRHYARCSDPTCDQNYIIWPVSAALAREYEDHIQAEDMAYQAEEEASNE